MHSSIHAFSTLGFMRRERIHGRNFPAELLVELLHPDVPLEVLGSTMVSKCVISSAYKWRL